MKISSVKNNIVYKNYNKPNVAFLAKKNDYLNNEQGFLDSVVSFAKLRTNGFSVGYSLGSCAYTKAEIDTMIKLKKLGFSEEACILGSKLKEDKIKFAVGLKDIGYSDLIAVYSAKDLNNKKFERIKKLYNNGFKQSAISIGSLYSDKQIEMVIKFKELGFNEFDSESGALVFTKNQLYLVKKLIDVGFEKNSLIKHSKNLDENFVQKATLFLNLGLGSNDALNLASRINNSQMSLAIKLINAGFSAREIESGIDNLKDDKIDKCIQLKKEELPGDFCIRATTLNDDKKIENAKILLKSGFDSYMSVFYAQLVHNNNHLLTMAKLRELGVYDSTCVDLSDRVEMDDVVKNSQIIAEFSRLSDNKEVNSLFVEYFLTKDLNLSSKTYQQRIKLIEELSYQSGVKQCNEKVNELFAKTSVDFDKLIKQIKGIEQQAITLSDVKDENVINFAKIFLANDKKNTKVLREFNFENFKNYGLPLKYSRRQFLADLSLITADLENSQKKQLFGKLEINPILSNEKIIGYDGILSLNKLDKENAKEMEVYKLVDKFINQNEINTYDNQLNIILNSLIQAYPEFINIIGKKQHNTHKLSLDIHILSVLSNALKNKEYDKLSDINKVKLKLAILFHDIAKMENEIDVNHPDNSAQYSKDLLKKIKLPEDIKKEIVELIKKHHWLKSYNTKEFGAEKTAILFRKKDEIKLARIMAEADLKGVSGGFWNTHKSALSVEKQKPIDLFQEQISSTGQIIYSSKIIKPELIPEVEFENEKYKILDFTKINENEDLSKYGFLPKTTKENLRLFIHVFLHFNIKDLYNLNSCTKKNDNLVLSTSFISPKNKTTYYNEKFGVLLDTKISDIVSATHNNQGSGTRKDLDDFVFNSLKNTQFRKEIPNSIKKKLKLNNDEYIKLFNYLLGKKYLNQIKDDEKIVIGDKEIKGKAIKQAILLSQDDLISNSQNEICLFKPEIKGLIAKVDTLKEIPKEFLFFAKQNELPIFILGH